MSEKEVPAGFVRAEYLLEHIFKPKTEADRKTLMQSLRRCAGKEIPALHIKVWYYQLEWFYNVFPRKKEEKRERAYINI